MELQDSRKHSSKRKRSFPIDGEVAPKKLKIDIPVKDAKRSKTTNKLKH